MLCCSFFFFFLIKSILQQCQCLILTFLPLLVIIHIEKDVFFRHISFLFHVNWVCKIMSYNLMKSSDFGNFLQILHWDIANKKVNFVISVHRYFFFYLMLIKKQLIKKNGLWKFWKQVITFMFWFKKDWTFFIVLQR